MIERGKRLGRLIARGQAVVQSVTVSRSGHRWYASVLCKVTRALPDRPTRAQQDRGRVGVDLGVRHLAVLSRPLAGGDPASASVENPRHVRRAEQRMTKAQRALSRTQKGSGRRRKAVQKVARLHHEVAVRRATVLHALTKQLATRFATVAVEDLNVAGMTRSARGTPRPARPTREAESRPEPGRPRRRPRRTAPTAHLQDFLVRLHPRGPGPLVTLQQDLLHVRMAKPTPHARGQDVPLPHLQHPNRPGPQRRTQHRRPHRPPHNPGRPW